MREARTNPSQPLPEDRPGTGECCEAQADGVPCSEPTLDCPFCRRARPKAVLPDLGGIMMCDGLYPTAV